MTGGIRDSVRSYYEDRLSQHGATARGVDWKDGESQSLRHRVLTDLVRPQTEDTIIDFGCGYGSYLGFLRGQGFRGEYHGIDLSELMIQEASQLYGDDLHASFNVGDAPLHSADIIVVSGVFNVRAGNDRNAWSQYVDQTIELPCRSVRKRIAMNFMSVHSDPTKKNANLHYESIGRIADKLYECVGRHLEIRQNYGLYEFSICA